MMVKTCTTCGETKPIDQFSLARNGRAQQKPVRKSKCKPCQAAVARKWFADNPERTAANLRRRGLATYGLTIEEYEQIAEAQGHRCAICGERETTLRNGKLQRLAVDHCHTIGRVRGLLCNTCNRAIGLFRDNVETLRKAIDYLERE